MEQDTHENSQYSSEFSTGNKTALNALAILQEYGNKTASNALEVLQEYGSITWPPSSNVDVSCYPFNNINLNSVEDEDAFLYGDSNSVLEKQICDRNDSVSNTETDDTGWSDEDDPVVEIPRTVSTNLNSNLTKQISNQLSVYSQTEIKDYVKLEHVEKEENLIEGTLPSSATSEKTYASPQSESHSLKSNTGILYTACDDKDDPIVETCRNILSTLNSALTKNISDCGSQNQIKDILKLPQMERIDYPIANTVPFAEIDEITCDEKHKLISPDAVFPPIIEKNEHPEISSTLISDESKHIADELPEKLISVRNNLTNIDSSAKLKKCSGTLKNVSEHDKSSPLGLKTSKTSFERKNPRILNKKYVDNIKEYITKPQRKRYHPRVECPVAKHAKCETPRFSPSRRHSHHRLSLPDHKSNASHHTEYRPSCSSHRLPSLDYGSHYSEELPVKKNARYETSRHFSSSRRRSPHRSPLSNHDHKSSKRHTKCESPYSGKRLASFESEKRPSRDSANRRRNLSSFRWSHTPNCRRRRRSRKKVTDYNRTHFNHKSPYKSKDSLDSNSSSFDGCDESLGEKKSFKQTSVKRDPTYNGELENEIVKFKGFYTYLEKSDSTRKRGLSKNPSDTYDVKKYDGNRLYSVNDYCILNTLQPPSKHQKFNEILHSPKPQPIFPDCLTSTSAAVTDIADASDMQVPVISSSESYDYTKAYSAQVTHFPQMNPPTAIMMTPPPIEYGPYLQKPIITSKYSQYATNVASNSEKVRPSTFRIVPMSNSLLLHLDSNSSTTIRLGDFSLQESTTKHKTIDSLKSSKHSFENKTNNGKEIWAEKNVSSSSEHIKNSTTEQKSGLEIKVLEQMKSSNQERKVYFVKEQNKGFSEQKSIKGAEFVKLLNGFLCVLCKEVFIDKSSVEQHLEGSQHFANYSHIKKHTTYGSIDINAKNIFSDQSKDPEDKKIKVINGDINKGLHVKPMETVNEVQNKELDCERNETGSKDAETAHENRNGIKIAFTCKAKASKLRDASRHVYFEDSLGIKKKSEVQKVISTKQGKDELPSQYDESDNCREIVEKIVHKYVFIGKSPGYKKNGRKNTPRCKRESIFNKKVRNSGDLNDQKKSS